MLAIEVHLELCKRVKDMLLEHHQFANTSNIGQDVESSELRRTNRQKQKSI